VIDDCGFFSRAFSPLVLANGDVIGVKDLGILLGGLIVVISFCCVGCA